MRTVKILALVLIMFAVFFIGKSSRTFAGECLRYQEFDDGLIVILSDLPSDSRFSPEAIHQLWKYMNPLVERKIDYFAGTYDWKTVIRFIAGRDSMDAIYPGSKSVGFVNRAKWNWCELLPEDSLSEAQSVRVAVTLVQGQNFEDAFDTLLHEIAHTWGAVHGSLCRSNGDPRGSNDLGPTDACWWSGEDYGLPSLAVRIFRSACNGKDDAVCQTAWRAAYGDQLIVNPFLPQS